MKPSQLGQIWPGAPAKESIVFIAWVLDGRLGHLTPLRPNTRRDGDVYSLSSVITLELEEMRGYPVLLLWRDGRFAKTTPARIPEKLLPAFRAVVKDDAATLGQLLASGLKGTERDNKTRSLGEHAALSGALNCLELLKARKGSFKTLPKQDNSALELAAAHGRSAAVRVLLESGIDPDGREQMQESPLYHAAVGGHLEAVEALLAKKAHVDELTRGNLTATVAALNEGQLVVAERLLRERVDFDFRSENTQLVFLSLCRDGKLGQARFYLEHGCSATKASGGRHPLMEGAYKGTAAFAEMLIKAGAPRECRRFRGQHTARRCLRLRQCRLRACTDGGGRERCGPDQGRPYASAFRHLQAEV
jgi:ankyrin repeat protein